MKQKQLEEIKSMQSRLRALGSGTPPNLERHVAMALCSGEVPKLRPATTIAGVARNKIIGERYGNREMKLADVFASTNGYKAEMIEWKSHQAKRKTMLSKFDKEAQKIMIKAIDPESDPIEIVEQLQNAAERAGLKNLKAPEFIETE